MLSEHSQAITLEEIVRNVLNTDRGDMGGYVTSDEFVAHPLNAALIVISRLWLRLDRNKVNAFIEKWAPKMENYEDEISLDMGECYVKELQTLIADQTK